MTKVERSTFVGQVCLVTGGGGDIGRATAARLARDGAAISLVDLDPRTLTESEQVVRAAGGEALSVIADIRDSVQVRAAVDATVRKFGAIHGVFNAAGVQGPNLPIPDYPADDFRLVIEINLVGMFNVLQYAIPAMLASGGGAIVNVASATTFRTYPRIAGYAASKSGVLGLTGVAAREFASQGIRVNAISPGAVDTAMMNGVALAIDPANPAQARAAMEQDIPDGRWGKPEEIADLVAFLLSPHASHITGANLRIDGGEFA